MLNSLVVVGSRPILLAQFARSVSALDSFRFIASKKATFLFKASSIRKRKRVAEILPRPYWDEYFQSSNIFRLLYNQQNARSSLRGFLSNHFLNNNNSNNKTTGKLWEQPGISLFKKIYLIASFLFLFRFIRNFQINRCSNWTPQLIN